VSACKAADITLVTLWHWRKKYPKFNEEIQAVINSRIQVVEDVLFREVLKGNATLIMFYLQNKAPQDWQDKRAIALQHSGKIEHTFEEKLNKMNDAELIEIAGEMRKELDAILEGKR